MYAIPQNVKVVFLKVFYTHTLSDKSPLRVKHTCTRPFSFILDSATSLIAKNNRLSRYVNLLAVLQLTQSVTCKGAQKPIADGGRVSEPNCL